jgi:hypothetical protein
MMALVTLVLDLQGICWRDDKEQIFGENWFQEVMIHHQNLLPKSFYGAPMQEIIHAINW